MSLLGLDIGTTGCKAAVFNETGTVLACHYQSYALAMPAPDRCELNPETVWRGIVQVVRAAAGQAGRRDPVRAVGVTAIGDSVTPLGRDGQALAPTVVGSLDRRAAGQARRLGARPGRRRLYHLTGVPLHSMSVLPKVMWFRDCQPEVYAQTWRFAGLQELVQVRLGLDPVLDYSQACRNMLLDIRSGQWADDLLRGCGIEREKFAPLVPPTQVVGRLGPRAAAELGLPTGTAWVAGGFDQACAALGRGVTATEQACLSLGTVGLIAAVSDRLRLDESLLAGNHGCGQHVVPHHYLSLAYVITSGATLRWYRDTLGVPDKERAEAAGLDAYQAMIDATPDRPASVFVLPYLAGTGTPWLDPHQRGAIFGLALDTPRSEIVKGILEGLAYEFRVNLESLAASGFVVKLLKAMGGGAQSGRWMQLVATITGVPVETVDCPEAGCLGAAFLAGQALGVFSALTDVAGLLHGHRCCEPEAARQAEYANAFRVYLDLRRRVKGLRLGPEGGASPRGA